MPIQYRIDVATGVLHVTAEGRVSDAELRDFATRAAGDPELRSGIHELIDLRSADLAEISSGLIPEVASVFGAHDRGRTEARIAIVASDDAAYGLSRMYQAYRDDAPFELRVFRDLEDARAWLGLASA